MNPVRDFGAAVRLLTVIPFPGAPGSHPRAYFSWVGVLFGALSVAIASGSAWIGADEGLVALLAGCGIVLGGVLLSRALHWDGLADTVDAIGARGGNEARLAVMRDSRTGAFGVTAIVMAALVQVIAAAAIIESGSWWALGAAPVFGRWAAMAALGAVRAARTDGLAASLAGRLRPREVVIGALPVVGLLAAPPALERLIVAVAVLIVALVTALWLGRRFGGLTGDTLGAVVLIVETATLVCGALIGGLV